MWEGSPEGEIDIRPFATADQTAARRLILAGLGEHFGSVDAGLNSDIADIAASYVVPGHLFLVARIGDGLVGTGGLVFQDARVGQIVRVSVTPECRRRGIGRALVRRLLDAARARGLTRVWMETNDDWHDAIGLYRRCGFRPYRWADGNVYMAVELADGQGPPSHFGGSVYAKSTPCCTQPRRSVSSRQPAASTITQPVIGRPVRVK